MKRYFIMGLAVLVVSCSMHTTKPCYYFVGDNWAGLEKIVIKADTCRWDTMDADVAPNLVIPMGAI